MASETATPPVNGNYASQPPYTGADHQSNPSTNGQSTAASASNATEAVSSPSKDEVGWYFVEQYYTTLSKSPEKLHLFYAKRSQFVSGVEAEKVSVSVGQRAIAERIKELDIQDCKVRVSNVDSQESFKNIVVQVIGEMSNKSAPHRKFAQTFVLAEQPNGYFVLNDIFRYIAEEDDDELENEVAEMEAQEDVPEPEQPAPTNATSVIAEEKTIEQADKKLEETAAEPKDEPKPEATTSPELSVQESESHKDAVEEKPAEVTNPEVIAEAEKAVALEATQPEAPKDPQPSPAPSSPKPSKANPVVAKEPVAAPKPAAPKTWASLVATRNTSPAVPVIPSANVSTQQPKAASSVVPAQTVTTTPAAEETQGLPSPGGWQTAGQEHHKKQNRQQGGSTSQGGGDRGNVHGYIKNVSERVDPSALRQTLSQFGKLEHFDVNKTKNCAFVEFANTTEYTAAVAANPHVVGGEELYVEERRRNMPYTGGPNGRGGRGGMRGGMENRTPSSGGRGGYSRDGQGRGGFPPRGRGGNITPRGGRGMPQAA